MMLRGSGGVAQQVRNWHHNVQAHAARIREHTQARSLGATVSRLVHKVLPQPRPHEAAVALRHVINQVVATAKDSNLFKPLNAGTRAAFNAIQVDDADPKRARAAHIQESGRMDRDVRGKSTDLFARANGRNATAEGTWSNDLVEQVHRDSNGNVNLIERATRADGQVTYERTAFAKGLARRETFATGGDEGSLERVETWAQAPSADPARPTTDVLRRRPFCDPNFQMRERSLQQDGDKLILRERAADSTGNSETTQTYRTQTNRDGIHGDLDDKFQDGQSIQVVETKAKRQALGQPEEEMTTTAYSQGQVRATSVDTRDAKGESLPRQWSLEIQNNNTYDRQDFVEGNESFKSLTHREADGLRFTERTSTEYKGEAGVVKFGSEEQTTFNTDGSVRAFHHDGKDESGVRLVQDYQRVQHRTERGLEAEETNSTSVTNEYDVTNTNMSRTRTLATQDHGLQVLESEQTISGQGATATSRVDGTGQTLFVNGREIKDDKDFARISEHAKDLSALSTAASARELQGYIGVGKNVFSLLGTSLSPHDLFPGGKGSLAERVNAEAALDPTGRNILTRLNNGLNARYVSMFGKFGVDAASKVHALTSPKLGIAAGTAGAVSASFGLVDSVRSHNYSMAAQNAVALGASGYGVFDSGRSFINAARGAETVLPGERATNLAARALKPLPGLSNGAKVGAALRFGSFAKFTGGVGNVLGIGLSGYQVYDGIRAGDAATIAKGGVGLAAAVGTGAAIGVWGAGVGAVVGAGAGVVAYGANKVIDAIADKEHDIPDVVI